MLVIKRQPGQSIVIQTKDGIITLHPKGLPGGVCKIAIEAPIGVRVWRKELFDDQSNTMPPDG